MNNNTDTNENAILFSTGSDPNHSNSRQVSRQRIAVRKRSFAGPASPAGRPPLFGGNRPPSSGEHHQASFGSEPPPAAIPFTSSRSSNHVPSYINSPVQSVDQSAWTPASPQPTSSLKRAAPEFNGYGEDASASDLSSCRGLSKQNKRYKDQDAQNAEKVLRAGYAKDQKASEFQEMVDFPDECIKAVGQSTDDGRVKVVFRQNMLVAFAKKEIEESEVRVKDLDEEKRLQHEELQTVFVNLDHSRQEELQELEQYCRERKQALERSHSEKKQGVERSHRESIMSIENDRQKTALVMEDMKRKVEIHCKTVQPVVKAMTDPAVMFPSQLISNLDYEMKVLVYATRLGPSVEDTSIRDIASQVGLDDYESCFGLSVNHAVAVLQALAKARFTSNELFNKHIEKMKQGKYKYLCLLQASMFISSNSTFPTGGILLY